MSKIFNKNVLNIMLNIMLNILGWTLLTLSMAPLYWAIRVLACPEFSAQCFDSDTIRLSGELVTMSGVLAVIGATLLVQSKSLADKKEQLSRYHLDSCVLAYKKACGILQDSDGGRINNDREKWIRAARMLVHAKELESNIIEKTHRLVFTVHMLEYQRILHAALSQPAGFYYGAPRELIADINASAKWAAEQEKQKKDFVRISDGSLHVMVEMAEWLVKYVEKDPLDEREFSQVFSEELLAIPPIAFLYPKLFAYLANKAGKTYPTGSENDDF